jgi:hypothetical protein
MNFRCEKLTRPPPILGRDNTRGCGRAQRRVSGRSCIPRRASHLSNIWDGVPVAFIIGYILCIVTGRALEIARCRIAGKAGCWTPLRKSSIYTSITLYSCGGTTISLLNCSSVVCSYSILGICHVVPASFDIKRNLFNYKR